jgi:hypothetical protein
MIRGMNKSKGTGFVMAAGVLFAAILAGCATAHVSHVSGVEFMQKAKLAQVMGSYENTRYVGCHGTMVILEEKHPALLGGGVVNTMYWTGLNELPTNIVAQLKAGTPPWTNWMDRSEIATNAPVAK